MTESTEDICDIQGIKEAFKELLDATGVETLMSLAESDAHLILQEMEQANGMLSLTSELPSISDIQSWIEQSRNLLNYHPEVEVHRVEPVAVTLEEEVLEEILYAIPVPGQHMVKQNIPVDQIPAMESFVEDEEVELQERVEPSQEPPRVSELPPVQIASKVAGSQIVRIEAKAREVVEIKPTPTEDRERAPIEPLSRVADIRKAPSRGLNAGKTPHSRGYIRGVLHPQPIRIRIAAIITIITMTLLPVSLVSGVLLLLKYPLWIAWIPAGFVGVALFYLMIARGMRCRICGQPIYAPKACRKHVKAHHIKFFGFIFPTCFHVLLFSWFRCIYCGTSIRVKE